MQFRFRKINPPPNAEERKNSPRRFRHLGFNTLRAQNKTEPIHWSVLFDFKKLPAGERTEETIKKPRKVRKRIHPISALRQGLRDVGNDLRRLFSAIGRGIERLRPPRRPKRIGGLPVFAGALCAALLVSALSASGVLFALFSGYGRSYVSVTIPDFLGKAPEEVLAAEGTSPERLNLILNYEYNPSVPKGTVISQSPPRGVHRRIYERDGKCTVVLTVSQGIETYELEELCGMDRRDALLTLRNRELNSKLTEQYSDAPKGTVLMTSPPAGTILKEGDSVTLTVSAGKKTVSSPIPDLLGKTEAEADALLRAAGLKSGKVSYEASSAPMGTVIRQEKRAYSAAERGEEIGYTVSAGDRFSTKTVPNLYGMTVEEATEALRTVGLVVGSVLPVSGTAASGSVIMQNPPPLSPITASTYSVDLYVIS